MDSDLVTHQRYANIARLIPERLNGNCVGAYSPALGGFVPNDSTLCEILTKMAAVSDSAN